MESIKQAAATIADNLPAIPGVTASIAPTQEAREPPIEEWLKADEVEKLQPDEEEKARQIGELINKQQQKNFDQHQHVFRGTHVKSLAFVKGTLTVSSSLSPHLAQGIFQPGATYPVIARYANEPTFFLPDNQRAPRGLGLKIFNAKGERLDSDYPTETQDFMFNNAPMVELTDVDTCLEIMQLREKYFDEPAKLAGALALRSDRMKQFAPATLPVNHLIGDTFHTQSSFSHGPFVAHISLLPSSPAQKPYINKSAPSSASPTFNREHLRSYYASNPAQYEFRAQFASDPSKHAIEDASTEWDESTAPWHSLATVDFPAQETFSTDRRVWWEDTIALSPWNGIKAHRPLGSLNRLRRTVYAMSRKRREQGNGRTVKFPESAEEMPN